jgi:hypothetical protein
MGQVGMAGEAAPQSPAQTDAAVPTDDAGGAGSSPAGSQPASAGSAAANGGAGTAATGAAGATQTDAAVPSSGRSFLDSFDGDGPLMDYTINNASALPDVNRVEGRYHAELLSNANDITLHYNQSQGRIDARVLRFPFEAIARNMGIGTVADSQTAAPGGGVRFNLAGVQVHVLDFESRNSAHIVVGHSGTANFSIEGKSTVDGVSVWDNEGPNVAPSGRADLRVVGDADHTLSVYWQPPNPDPGSQTDDWQPYNGTGKLSGPAPTFGPEVYVGLITYAVGETGVPFVGTCDSFEGIEQ